MVEPCRTWASVCESTISGMSEDSGKSSEGVGEPHEAQKPSLSDRLRQHWMLAAAAACISVVAVIVGLLYWLDIRHYESTDDAFVAARSFSVASKVGGYVTEIR